MIHRTKTAFLACVTIAMIGMPCVAQDVEVPFTWQGKGTGSFPGDQGIEEVDLQLELSVDAQGMVSGKAMTDDGASPIKHVFYTDKKSYDEIPGFFTRKLVIVFLIDEYGDNPMLAVVNGRALTDKFLYGEVMLTRYETDSETSKALGVGNPEATWMVGDEPSSRLKSVLNDGLPFGTVKFQGDFKKASSDM